ncbi:hypothetical protein VNO78_11493 [Psophocarpus tetragonolobus]|uniref:Uncharacterized protein n=1 Tax=Psophocarpus tetragonolobus TaxID=3891 RepID=A0AAN9SLI4_PSOTE
MGGSRMILTRMDGCGHKVQSTNIVGSAGERLWRHQRISLETASCASHSIIGTRISHSLSATCSVTPKRHVATQFLVGCSEAAMKLCLIVVVSEKIFVAWLYRWLMPKLCLQVADLSSSCSDFSKLRVAVMYINVHPSLNYIC